MSTEPKVPRSTFYYQPEPVREAELALMRAIDVIYTKWPFYGSLRMAPELQEMGHGASRKRVRHLMRRLIVRHGSCRDPPETLHQRQTPRPQDLPVFALESGH